MATDGDARATTPKELGLDDAMAYARELQKEDRLEAADELYRRIISVAPDYPDAWHFHGMVAFQLGRLAEAETLIRRAVEMLKRAGVRKLYDDLILGELTAFVGAAPAAWDLVVSADTLVYFGDLAPVMAAALRGLRPGGHLVFTLERASEAEAPQGFRINPHGRYSHTEAYVRRVLSASRLEPRRLTHVHLRLELKKPVEGLLVVAACPT